ncbi:MAG: DUF1015 domain-containing protein [bacterium]
MTTPTVAPFRGLRYNTQKIQDVSQVVAPPYDVIDEKYRDVLYNRHPNNVIRLILTKDDDGKAAGKNKYEAAKQYLDDWKKSEGLIRDDAPQIYVYHQTYKLEDGRELKRKGFIGLRRLESFEDGKIRPHEYTFAGPKADRLNLIKATETNLSPIFGIYGDSGRAVENLLKNASNEKPLFDIVTDDGNRHQLWGVSDPKIHAELNRLMENKTVFIADGHHRYETALNYRNLKRAELKDAKGDEPFNYVMMYLCAMEDEGLVILPTHRVVTVPPASPWKDIQERLQKHFDITEYGLSDEKKALARLNELSSQNIAFLVTTKEGLKLLSTDSKRVDGIAELAKFPKAVRDLDVVILHQYLLPHAFKMDVAEDHDSVKVQYYKDTQEALKTVGSGKAHLAFILNPTKMSQVQAVSEIGERMPHKSTFFYPKLLSGLVFNPLS